MKRTRTILSWAIFIIAVAIMVIPLPGEDESHLLTEAEANDDTLVILTSEDSDYLDPIVEQFISETNAKVRVETSNSIDQQSIKNAQADIVVAQDIDQLVPLIQDNALDTLPLDIMWNVHEGFRDPSDRWVGFTGKMINNEFTMSGLALAETSNSKPLAERFIIYLYSRSNQVSLVDHTGHYSFFAYGVPCPTGMPELHELTVPEFAEIYNSTALTGSSPNELASK